MIQSTTHGSTYLFIKWNRFSLLEIETCIKEWAELFHLSDNTPERVQKLPLLEAPCPGHAPTNSTIPSIVNLNNKKILLIKLELVLWL